MHLATRTLLVLSLLTFSATSFAKGNQALTKITRNTCLMFPKFIDFDKQLSSVHYMADQDSFSRCDEDEYGNLEFDTCEDVVDVTFKYRYTTVTTFDHYTLDGKLITTTQENSSNIISQKVSELTQGKWSYISNGDQPTDEASKNQLRNMYESGKKELETQISRIIFDSANSTCDNSFYHN